MKSIRNESAKELAEELPEPKPGERKILKTVIDDLSLDPPRKGLAAHRCSKTIKRLKSGTPDIQKFIMLNVIGETTKKLLFED